MAALQKQLDQLIARFPLGKQIFLFLLIGGICYFVGMFMLWAVVEGLKVEVNLANLISSVITIFVCYLLNARFVFTAGKYSRHKEIAIFYGFALVGLLMNVGLMYVMTTYVPIHYLVSKTLIIVFLSVFNFTTRKFVVFKG